MLDSPTLLLSEQSAARERRRAPSAAGMQVDEGALPCVCAARRSASSSAFPIGGAEMEVEGACSGARFAARVRRRRAHDPARTARRKPEARRKKRRKTKEKEREKEGGCFFFSCDGFRRDRINRTPAELLRFEQSLLYVFLRGFAYSCFTFLPFFFFFFLFSL